MATNIYILRLEQGKYYIGKSEDPQKRFTQHLEGNGSMWTKKYKPLELVQVINSASNFDEDKCVKEYMNRYGISNVRGGSYSSEILTADQIRLCQMEIRGANDRCFRCGGNHFVKDCLDPRSTNSIFTVMKIDWQDEKLQEHKHMREKRADNCIKNVLTSNYTSMARMLYDIYSTMFVCADPEKGIWYMFRNHRWHRIKKAIALRKKIRQDFVPRFLQEQKKLYDEIKNKENPDEEYLKNKMKEIKTVLKGLNSAPFMDNIVKEMVDLFYDKNADFIDRLDADINLLGFDNGVFDIQTMSFREGRHTDYVSKSTGYDYQDFSDDHPRVMEIKDFFVKVFPDTQLRRFFLEYAAQLLKGGNFNKLFLNMIGGDNSAKSVTIELIEKMLGSYAVKFPTSLITGKRTQSSSAVPEVTRSIGARFATIQEPENVNTDTLEKLTSNDSMFARGLYSDGREFKPMFKLGLVTNKLIHLSGNDAAIWNRILVLPFEGCFPKDIDFSEKIPSMRQPLMWLLIQVLKETLSHGPSAIPLKVTKATEKYRQNIEESNDAENEITNSHGSVVIFREGNLTSVNYSIYCPSSLLIEPED